MRTGEAAASPSVDDVVFAVGAGRCGSTMLSRLIDSPLRDGLQIPEIVYPYASGRFNPATGTPVICYCVLPRRCTTMGVAALRELPSDLWTTIKYESLLSDPEAELTELAKFLEATALPGSSSRLVSREPA